MLITLVMIKNFPLLLIVLFMFIPQLTDAQKRDFGDISKQMIEMDVYEKDSTASAVVIFDVGDAELDNRLEVEFRRHIRIKILTDEGFTYGDFSKRYIEKNPEQDITRIKAATYNLENGSIVKTELDKDDILIDKEGDDYTEVKFTMPALRPGSIIEYEYLFKSDSPIDLPDWDFQKSIPSMWSEYMIRIPEWFRYLKVSRGYESFFSIEEKPYQSGGRQNYVGTESTWVMKDIPAIEEAPYMKSIDNYRSAIKFQLANITVPGVVYEDYLSDWPRVGGALAESSSHGKKLKRNKFLANILEDIISEEDSELEKMKKIYTHVSSHMNWNEMLSFNASQDLEDSYKEGDGNSADINLMLINMLKEAGLSAHSVVLSTTDHGDVIRMFPLISQFNHVIAYVEIGSEFYFLDAKNEKRPFNLLPANSINSVGFLIDIPKEQFRWINIENKDENNLSIYIDAELNEDGRLVGVLNSKSNGYYALYSREDFEDEDEIKETIKQTVFSDPVNTVIDSANVKESELHEDLRYSAHFEVSANASGNVIYLNPMIVERLIDNPFKEEERVFPIDFDYTFDETVTLRFTIPEGWSVDEVPASKIFRTPDESANYRKLFQVAGNTIMMQYKFSINKHNYSPDDYMFLKDFFKALIENQSEQIVLKKNEE